MPEPIAAPPAEATESPALIPSISDQIDAIPSTTHGDAPPAAPAQPQASSKPTEAKSPPQPAQAAPPAAPKAEEEGDLPKSPMRAQEPVKPAQQTARQKAEDFKTNKELREAYNKVVAEAESYTSEIARVKAEIQAAKRAGADEASAALKQELEGLRKTKEEAENRIRYYDYRNSDEFKQKFQEPLNRAWRKAQQDVEGHSWEDERGQQQKVSNDTLVQIVNLPTMQAAQLANKVFGPQASVVMAHRDRIRDLNEQAQEAETTWKTKGNELAQVQSKQREQHMAMSEKIHDEHAAGLRKTAPELFERPTDPEEAKFYDKGMALVEKAYRGKGFPDGMTQEQRHAETMRAMATVGMRSVAFGALLQRHYAQAAKMAELEKQIAAFKGSTPKADGGKLTQTESKKEVSYQDAIDAIPGIR